MTDENINQGRRRVLTTLTSVAGAAGVVGAAVPFIGSWEPSAKAKAAGAPVEVNVSKLEPGAMITVEWRGKPVYIVRRTPEILAALRDFDMDKLQDPESTNAVQPGYIEAGLRSMEGNEEILVLLGLCTHLGCAPSYRPDVGAEDLGGENWLGGFFCRCHGSKFDMAGRVYKGVPAPTNLEIPPYKFVSDSSIVIGEDQEA